MHGNIQGADGEEFVDGGTPGGRVGEVDQVEDEAVWLTVKVTVKEAGALDFKRDVFARGPANDVGQEVAMIGEVVDGEASIDIGGEECDSRFSDFTDDKAGDGGA